MSDDKCPNCDKCCEEMDLVDSPEYQMSVCDECAESVKVKMTADEKALIEECSQDGGLLRKFMSSNEIKLANTLAKQDLLLKGTSDDKQKSVCFFNAQK